MTITLLQPLSHPARFGAARPDRRHSTPIDPYAELCAHGDTFERTLRDLEQSRLVNPEITGVIAAVRQALVAHLQAVKGVVEGLTEDLDTDTLTGLKNRRYYERSLPEQFAKARTNETSLVVMLVDMDGFKRVNDTYGHQPGDRVIRHVAHTLQNTVDERGDVCRIGGDEFAIILPGMNEAEATALAERLVANVPKLNRGSDAELKAELERIHLTNPITITVGLSVADATVLQTLESADELAKQADSALYERKRTGRNGFSVYQHQKAA